MVFVMSCGACTDCVGGRPDRGERRVCFQALRPGVRREGDQGQLYGQRRARTRYSAVPHPSTDRASCRSTSCVAALSPSTTSTPGSTASPMARWCARSSPFPASAPPEQRKARNFRSFGDFRVGMAVQGVSSEPVSPKFPVRGSRGEKVSRIKVLRASRRPRVPHKHRSDGLPGVGRRL